MTESPRTSIEYDDIYSQVISHNNYYEDLTNNQAPQASEEIPVSSSVQKPSEKETNNELTPVITFPMNVKIYRTINTFKILALLLYIALWIYQIIYNAINISLNNPSSVTSTNNGTLPYPIYYNPSASYGGAIIMTFVFTLSIIFLVIELAYLFITFRQDFIIKSHIIVSLVIFFIYLVFALTFNIIAALGALKPDIYSAMVALLWIIPLLSLLECFAGVSKWPIVGVVTISTFKKCANYKDNIYSIADGLIWVIVFCCFVEFIINEIGFKKTVDDFNNNNDDDSEA
ncbi:4477_t:CDS:2 [Cetraspora pellucida]|uniref:4477_t:CDS:1 n=1 Tax=Cetraspora pellucida TaxID=1433469 RepID=A0ACA9MQZ6_9GLOM|nr:4477_t:CDS:2 [Cetraspora pellucida]